jgi:hypothetical protein
VTSELDEIEMVRQADGPITKIVLFSDADPSAKKKMCGLGLGHLVDKPCDKGQCLYGDCWHTECACHDCNPENGNYQAGVSDCDFCDQQF